MLYHLTSLRKKIYISNNVAIYSPIDPNYRSVCLHRALSFFLVYPGFLVLTNYMFHIVSQMANICVRYFILVLRPTAIFSLRNKTVTESLHTIAVELFCNISGNPLPKVTWLRNDRTFEQIPLTESNCKNIQPGYYYYKDVPQKLIICNPLRTHTALYTCFAKNQLGNKSRNAYLDVLCEFFITILNI